MSFGKPMIILPQRCGHGANDPKTPFAKQGCRHYMALIPVNDGWVFMCPSRACPSRKGRIVSDFKHAHTLSEALILGCQLELALR